VVQQNTRIYISQNLRVLTWHNKIRLRHSHLEAFGMTQRNSPKLQDTYTTIYYIRPIAYGHSLNKYFYITLYILFYVYCQPL